MPGRKGLSLLPDPNSPFLGPVLVRAQLRLPTHPQGQLLRPPSLSAHQQESIQLCTCTNSLRRLVPKGCVPSQAARRPFRLPGLPLQLPHLSIQQLQGLQGRVYGYGFKGALCRKANPAAGLVSATGHTSRSALTAGVEVVR